MIVEAVHGFLSTIERALILAATVEDRYYKDPREVASFRIKCMILSKKTEQLQKLGAEVANNGLLELALEAREILEAQIREVEKLRRSQFRRVMKMAKGMAFPTKLTNLLNRMEEIVDAGPQLFLSKVNIRELVEEISLRTPAPLTFDFDKRYVPILETVNEVHTSLEHERVVTVYGIPGLGKTSLVKYLALNYTKEIDHGMSFTRYTGMSFPRFPDGVQYMFCGKGSQDKVQELLQGLLERLGFATNSAASSNGASSQAVISSLQWKLASCLANQTMLIIFDDLWEPAALEQLLVPASGVRYLITSRDREISRDAKKIELKKPTDEEASRILANHTSGLPTEGEIPDSIRDVTKGIMGQLENHPLSLLNVAISIDSSKATDVRHWEAMKDDLLSEESRRRAEEIFQEETFQHMPKFVVGIDIQAKRIRDKLQNIPTVGLVGMRGVGKTILAMAVFKELLPQFEYCCFVPDVNGVKGSIQNLLDLVWKQMHYKGRKVQQEADWSKLRGKRVLLVLDNISADRDGKVLSKIFSTAAADSRYILTSRDAELLQTLGAVCNVPLLENDSAEQLFFSHALPNCIIPSFIEFSRVIKAIVKHCEGLPLTLEVLGKYLRTKESEKDWVQVLHSLNEAQVKKDIEKGSVKLRLFYEGLPEEEKEICKELISGGQQLENEDIYNLYEDPLTYENMCDPVMCSDGRTYDRWTIIDQRISRSPFDRNVSGFDILCDNIDVRRKVFGAFPEQEEKFRNRRKKYRDEALQHARANPVEIEDALEKLNNVLKWRPPDDECEEERNRILRLVSQKNGFSQEMVPSPETPEDSLSTAPAVTDESQTLAPERPEDVLPTVLAVMEEGQTSMMPVSTQEVPAFEIPVVNHEDLMRASASDFKTRLPILLVFAYFVIMFFLI